jgi:cytochrome P450
MDVKNAGLVFCDPAAYADEARFYEACAIIRREDPVHRVEAEGFNPFWAITKHEDLLNIERDNVGWLAAPRPALGPESQDAVRKDIPIRTLVQMDPPDHAQYRKIGAEWFRPGKLRELEPRVGDLARRWVDRMADLDGECDFVRDVAMHFPLYVIMSILGLPEEDYPRMLQLTQEMFGSSDPELGRDDQSDVMTVLVDFFNYFRGVTTSRRSDPTGDLASAIANAQIDGAPIGDLEAIGYYVIVATAGHDTTSATIAGGLHALVQFPRAARTAQIGPIARSIGRGGDDPMGLTGEAIYEDRGDRPRHQGGPDCSGGFGAAFPSLPPTVTRTCSTSPRPSTPGETRTGILRSASGVTSASAPNWPG